MIAATTTNTTAAVKPTRGRKAIAKPAPEVAAAPALKVMMLQENLKRGLAMATNAVASKSTLPVLSNVLLVSEGASQLKISATNLAIGIAVTIAAKVERPGAITLPAKLLADVVGGLPNDTITLDMDSRTQSVTLTCARFEATIKGIDADEFPAIPTIADRTPTTTFAPEALCSAVGQVAFAAATDDTRPILTGVRIKLAGKLASFAAADTFRLTFRDIVLDRAVTKAEEVVVPARAMETLGKVLADMEGTVELLIDGDGDRVIFRAEEVELVSRVIDGKYPDVEKYLKHTFATVLEISTKELKRAVKLASFFASASANVVRLLLAPAADGKGKLTISANAAEVGDNTSQHDAVLRGTGGQVALNVRFLADGIDAISTPTIAIHYNSAQQPVVLTGVGDETFTYVAMPMTIHQARSA
jgi:DNA polymerase-3 subunit beta